MNKETPPVERGHWLQITGTVLRDALNNALTHGGPFDADPGDPSLADAFEVAQAFVGDNDKLEAAARDMNEGISASNGPVEIAAIVEACIANRAATMNARQFSDSVQQHFDDTCRLFSKLVRDRLTN